MFAQPLKGAKEDGVKGFFKGTVKGLVGLVTKPLAGVLDLASQTTAGVKATAAVFDDKANEKRERLPRVFYGKEKFFRTYVQHDSQILKDLFSFDDGKYSRDHFMQSFLFNEDSSSKNAKVPKFGVVLLTFEHIIYFDFQKKSIKFSIEPKFISSISRENFGLVFEVKDSYSDVRT